ncbi:MAG: hypothetical protein ACYSQZ_09665, partial [Planctomycetota bacterium]
MIEDYYFISRATILIFDLRQKCGHPGSDFKAYQLPIPLARCNHITPQASINVQAENLLKFLECF